MVKSIVLDNSALVPLFLPDESTEFSQRLLKLGTQGSLLISPSFLLIEFGNTIATAVRRNRITPAQAAFAHAQIQELPITLVDYVSARRIPSIHGLAIQYGLSFYDALYLALAMEEGASLATLDGKLKQAAVVIGVETW